MGPGRRLAILLAVAWLGVMIAAGCVLASSQERSRNAVAARVEVRTEYAASFVSIYARDLVARERAAAKSWFASTAISRGAIARTFSALGLRGGVLLDAHGQTIAAAGPRAAPLDMMLAGLYGGFAASGDTVADSQVSLSEVGGKPVVSFAIAYPSSSGRRVFAGAYGVPETVLPTVLGHVLTAPGWRAELTDEQGGRVVEGFQGRAQGEQVQFSAVVHGTPWRIIGRAPAEELYGFLDGAGRWLAWVALGGLAVAGLVVIVLFARLQRRRVQLIALNDELARLAAIDPLTGLRNRRAIEEYLHDALSAARRHILPLSVLVIDVDHFKNFNDTLGHRSGDAVLAHAAEAMNGALRAEDAIGRWGGEEFLVVLPGTDEEGARHAAERLRAALAGGQPEEARTHGLPVTVTIGLAEWRHEEADELVSRADGALYLGKRAGRDTVQAARIASAVLDAGEPA